MAYRGQVKDNSLPWLVVCWVVFIFIFILLFINFNFNLLKEEPIVEIREVEKVKIKEILVHDCEIKPTIKTLTIYNGNQRTETSYKE